MDLGTQLKLSRETAGFSQNYVAKKLNISRQAVSQWENGKSYPDIDNLIILSELYHFDLNKLINENIELKETIALSEQQIDKKKFQLGQDSKKENGFIEEGYLLLILACFTYLLAPLGLLLIPILIWKNNRNNILFRTIYITCFTSIIYNALIIYWLLSLKQNIIRSIILLMKLGQ